MKSKFLAAAFAVGLLAGISGTAQAIPVTIGFDGLAPGVDVTNQFAGVTFANIRTTVNVNTSPPNSILSISALFEPKIGTALVATFSSAASMVSLQGISVGLNGIRIDAYDAAVGGNVIDFDEFIGAGTGSGVNHLLSVAAAGILRVEWYQPLTAGLDAVLWDDFTFDSTATVSEPGTLAVLGLGLLGLGIARRKRAA